MDDISILLEYQQVLNLVISELSKLRYLLGKGNVSSEMCYSIFNKYSKHSNKIRQLVEKWHIQQIETYGIDLEMNHRIKRGMESLVSRIPSAFDNRWKYKQLENGLIQNISDQSHKKPIVIDQPKDLYNGDVQIIIKDGKYYY